MIGRALVLQAEGSGLPCVATSRKPGASHFLDLNASPDTWSLPVNVETAILCAAVTGLATCENDRVHTRAVNVTATIALANRLASQGAKISFLSSNQVFGPEVVTPAEDHPPGPVTEYGRQKFAVERHLLENHPDSQIIRLTKVISPSLPLFTRWMDSLAHSQSITAYSDLYFSPLEHMTTAATILEIVRIRHAGIFHISAADSLSYFDAARWLTARTGTDPALIQCAPAPYPNTPDSCRFNCERTVDLTGYCLSRSIDHLQELG